jgi:hypothetical protein
MVMVSAAAAMNIITKANAAVVMIAIAKTKTNQIRVAKDMVTLLNF